MPTMTARYGQTRSNGADDRQQLTSIAALIAADPRLKPTTAIRSLGVEDPVVIRRLRTKFRAEQPKLMAQAQRARRANSRTRTSARPNGKHSRVLLELPVHQAAAPREPDPAPLPTQTHQASMPPWLESSTAIFNAWCDIGFLVARAAVEKQSALTQQVLSMQHVSMTLRSQLALNSVAVAIYMRSTGRTRRLSKLH